MFDYVSWLGMIAFGVMVVFCSLLCVVGLLYLLVNDFVFWLVVCVFGLLVVSWLICWRLRLLWFKLLVLLWFVVGCSLLPVLTIYVFAHLL